MDYMKDINWYEELAKENCAIGQDDKDYYEQITKILNHLKQKKKTKHFVGEVKRFEIL